MNPLTQTLNQLKMNERELEMGLAGTSKSWHQEYKDSAWVFLGGLPYEMTEGDVICMFSQYGEPVHINLIRDHNTGKSKGFGFLCYMDQRSTVLAVDNLNGIKVLGRTIRVDHVHNYKLPKDLEKLDQDKRKLFEEGCAPKELSPSESEEEDDGLLDYVKPKKEKKKKKDKKKKKKKRRHSTDSDPESEDDLRDKAVKRNPVVREEEPRNGNRMSAKDMFTREERNGKLSDVRDRDRDGGNKSRKSEVNKRERDRRESRSRSRDRRVKRSRSRDRRMEKSRSRSRERKRSVERRVDRSRSRSRDRKRSSERSRQRVRSRSRSRDNRIRR